MSDPTFGNLPARLRRELRRQESSNPDSGLVKLLKDTLAYLDVPDPAEFDPNGTRRHRLRVHIERHPGRTIGWHARRLDLDPDKTTDTLRDLLDAGDVVRRSVKVLYGKETP